MMRSSKSFFNWAILRKDITRFLPLWLVYILLTVNITDLNILFLNDGLDTLDNSINLMSLSNFAYALIVGLCLFSDVSHRRLCNALHTLPIRRESWFATHMLAGVLFWIIPILIKTALYCVCLWEYWYLGLLWLVAMVVQYLFFLSLAALCAMCTGTKVATTVMYFLLNFGSWLVFVVVQNFYQPLVKGIEFGFDWAVWMSPVSKLVSSEYWIIEDYRYNLEPVFVGLDAGWWYVLILGVLTVVSIALGILAYRKRKLEHAGEFVVFRFLRPAIWLSAALTIGLLFQGIGVLSGFQTVSLLFGLVVGGLLSEMLVTKTVKSFLKGLIKGVILSALVGLSMLIVIIDPFGTTRWVPDAEDVAWVQISEHYDYENDYYYYESQTMTDAKDIQRVLDAHAELTKDSIAESDFLSVGYDYNEIYIKYHLTDGTEEIRRYYYPTDSEATELLEPLWTKAEYVVGYDDWEKFLDQQQWVTIRGNKEYQLDAQQTKELLKAVKADCDEGTWARSGEYICDIDLDQNNCISVFGGSYHTVTWIRRNLTADVYW